MNRRKIEKRRIIVLAFEGKNNKTETHYFSHFKPKDPKYDIKCFSTGVTDPRGMINSTKAKRKDLDYDSRYDLTFIFIDCDCNENKRKLVEELEKKQHNDIKIIKSNPSFETWFLNHFMKTTREFDNAGKLIDVLKKYLINYDKNKDYFDILKGYIQTAIKNSEFQLNDNCCKTFSEVVKVVTNYLITKD